MSHVETAIAFTRPKDISDLHDALHSLLEMLESDHPGGRRRLGVALQGFDLSRAAKDMKIRRLEYCRALHAEENALLQLAKLGGISVDGGTLYTTASPCELCTKMICQVGIKHIVYTEVYPSRFSDAFREDGVRHIEFEQFEGVKSPGYYRLFKPEYPMKDVQDLRRRMPQTEGQ